MYVSVRLYVRPSVCPSVRLNVNICVRLFVILTVCNFLPFVCACDRVVSVRMSVCLSVRFNVCIKSDVCMHVRDIPNF